MKKAKLDVKTLQALLAEAKENYAAVQKLFEETDDVDDMHAAEQWHGSVKWLERKLMVSKEPQRQ
jgi:hypothetical protein